MRVHLHPIHILVHPHFAFVVYLAYQRVNPLYALFTTPPQPVTNMPVHVHRLSTISIINPTLPSTIRAVMASNNTSDSECYLAV